MARSKTVSVDAVLRALQRERAETMRVHREAPEISSVRLGMNYRQVALIDAMTIVKRVAGRQRKPRKK